MNVRGIKITDMVKIMKLHDKFYRELEQPSFLHTIDSFLITDDNDEIITAGMIEKVAEGMLVTNKHQSEIKIGKALIEAQSRMSHICKVNNIRDLYAFVDNNTYAKHLLQHGFIESNRAFKLRV
jgi:hypothetical protein